MFIRSGKGDVLVNVDNVMYFSYSTKPISRVYVVFNNGNVTLGRYPENIVKYVFNDLLAAIKFKKDDSYVFNMPSEDIIFLDTNDVDI